MVDLPTAQEQQPTGRDVSVYSCSVNSLIAACTYVHAPPHLYQPPTYNSIFMKITPFLNNIY